MMLPPGQANETVEVTIRKNETMHNAVANRKEFFISMGFSNSVNKQLAA
jgi:hypothetical protein